MEKREQSAEDVFEAALDLPAAERSSFLDRICGESPDLRREVEDLLRQDHELGSFLGRPVLGQGNLGAFVTSTGAVERAVSPGTRFGRYAILSELGNGGMGVVFRARDERLERTVALKLLPPGAFSGEEARRRFRREALALAKLCHPHIAAVYDVGEEDGVDYLVMECVPGASLAEKLTGNQMPLNDATEILLQLGAALEEAHEQGVIHRDLKPGNIMLTPKSQVKVLDFGLAKLFEPMAPDATRSSVIMGTPLYMSPEQVHGREIDARTDLWSLGVIFYQLLTGVAPFQASTSIGVMRAVVEDTPPPLTRLRPDLPALASQIVTRALAKDPAERYANASAMLRDAKELKATLQPALLAGARPRKSLPRMIGVAALCVSLLLAAVSGWLLQRNARRRWAREEAVPQINRLLGENRSLAAFLLLEKALRYLPNDPQLASIAEGSTTKISVTSTPAGAAVSIQDYLTPEGPWYRLGSTPLEGRRIPQGYFRWKLSSPGLRDVLVAPGTEARMNFSLEAAQRAPKDMVPVPAAAWQNFVAFVGWLGPYDLPPFLVDRFEVTNREYQAFVDSGGYGNRRYWPATFTGAGQSLSWDEAMAAFRDTTNRPGPANWAGGHYPEGGADLPVSGVSWFEASAYAAFAGKRLPVLAQWFQFAPADLGGYAVAVSNIARKALAPVGTFSGLGAYGTYDTAGNVREWSASAVDNDLRFIPGGSWRSPSYLYTSPEAASPFDRSDTNGFRCVKNLGSMPAGAEAPVQRVMRDFSHLKPASDEVFRAYKLLYTPDGSPLDAAVDGTVRETVDWREERVEFNTGYRGQRMSAYLFIPKRVRPPYETVLFFPSARVFDYNSSADGRELGDLQFFDYILQSGRAVMYPTYEGTYERRINFFLPSASQDIQLTTDLIKDASRSLDYLATRPDINKDKMAYLGVSMGAATGVIATALLQDHLKTSIFLDGGYFLDPPPPGGDQADFAPRIRIPVLMVNGRFDYVFSVDKAQNPLFAMLGTPAADKRHVLFDTPHDVTERRPQLVASVLDWLDHYLGPVQE